MSNENQPSNNKPDNAASEELLGGTTNLSLDQLKEEGGPTSTDKDNPNGLSDPDDLHEIQAADDLDEPDTDDSPEAEENEGTTEYPGGANPVETNS